MVEVVGTDPTLVFAVSYVSETNDYNKKAERCSSFPGKAPMDLSIRN